MSQTLISGPHTLASSTVSRTMLWVMLALTPATLWGLWLFGWPAINLFLVTVLSALVWEALCLRLAGRSVQDGLFDGSALLTGWLLALTLPPTAPAWIGVVGSFIAIVVGKQVFGGLGQNLFNPAMVARVALLVSFPVQLTRWTEPTPLAGEGSVSFSEGLAISFGDASVDAITGASLLGDLKTHLSNGQSLTAQLADSSPLGAQLLGSGFGSLGETSALLIALGGGLLLALGIIRWMIPLGMLGSVALLAFVSHLLNPDQFLSPALHLTSGALMLGAFFIATDYVTSPSSWQGQLLFGIGCGVLTWVIRTFGGYPEGVAFAVLLMNAMTPLIDYGLKPRIFGRDLKGNPLKLPEHSAEEAKS